MPPPDAPNVSEEDKRIRMRRKQNEREKTYTIGRTVPMITRRRKEKTTQRENRRTRKNMEKKCNHVHALVKVLSW